VASLAAVKFSTRKSGNALGVSGGFVSLSMAQAAQAQPAVATKAVQALLQRIEYVEKQMSGFNNSGMTFQRVDSLENLVVGLRHQVEGLGTQMASFPLQVKSVVAHAVQEQMTYVWEQQLQLVQQHAASCGSLEEKLQRHETQLEYHAGLLQDIQVRKADKNYFEHQPSAHDDDVNVFSTAYANIGQAVPQAMEAGSQTPSHAPGQATPLTAPNSPWMHPATALSSLGPPGGPLALATLIPESPAPPGGAPAVSSQAQARPDAEMQESNCTSPSGTAAAGADQVPPQGAVAVGTDFTSDGEATLSAEGSAPEKFGDDACSDAPSGTHSVASAGARYGWPLQPKSLFHAINSKDEAMVLAILACPDFVELNATNEHGCTALHRAAWHGLAEACQALLDRPEFNAGGRADVNGWTALHCAGARGQVEACRVLLRHPISAAAALQQDRCGCTPLHRAVLSGRGEVCRLLLQHPDLSEDCPSAADGRTALHCAASGGHAEACLVLLEHPCGKAALTMRDASGCIPLEVALGKARQVLSDAEQRLTS